jgi:DNA-binding NarL/FixJ family response regulator
MRKQSRPARQNPRRRRRAGPPAAPRPKRRIFLVDDHPIVRNGLALVINHEPDLVVVGEGEEAYPALRAIRKVRPDLVLVDISLKSSDGIDLIHELQKGEHKVAALVVSTHDESLYAERALRAGARGYVMKQEPPDTLLTAIRTVLAGQVYVSPHMGGMLLRAMVDGERSDGRGLMRRLTDRQMQIFREMGTGKSIKEIAEALFLSVSTIEAHREHIKAKLHLDSSIELLRYAILNSPDAK